MAQAERPSIQFIIQRIYIKDLSFEAPGAPQVFRERWEPSMKVDLHTHHQRLESSVYDIELHVTVTVKQADKVAFLVEVKQAGIFTVEGLAAQELEHALNSYCPNILFPYAREAISDAVMRGGFPQLILAPINFDALYQEQLTKQQQETATQTTIAED